MADVRANSGVPVVAQFGGVGTPTACAPLVVDSATGFIYSWKAGDVIVAAGAGGTVTSVGATFTGGMISVGGSPITTSGTLALTVAGTSGGIPYFSGAATWASSGVLAANALVTGGGAGAAPATVTTGAGVLTALGVAIGNAGAPVTFNGALGTPSSGVVTNLTGTAAGVSIGGNAATVTTNANLTGPITSTGNATAVASQTGTGSKFVMQESPTINTANLVGSATNDAAAAGSIGEYIESSVTGQTITTSEANLTSISLTAGDWDVSAAVETTVSGATNTYILCAVSQTSNTRTGAEAKDYNFGPTNVSGGIGLAVVPRLRVSLASTTTIYLVARSSSATITTSVAGYISARRMR